MATARLGKEIRLEAPDEIGTLAKVCTVLANAGINIQAICAYGEGEKAIFLMVTSDNKTAMKSLKPLNFSVREQEVVIMDLEDKVGAMGEVSRKISSEKVNLKYIYGSTSAESKKCMLIVQSEDNAKVVKTFV